MRSWAEWVLRHRKWIIGFWFLVIVVGGALSNTVNNRLTIDFSLPGQPGTDAAHKIEKLLHNGGETSPYLVSLTAPAGKTVTGNEAAIGKTFAASLPLTVLPAGAVRLTRYGLVSPPLCSNFSI